MIWREIDNLLFNWNAGNITVKANDTKLSNAGKSIFSAKFHYTLQIKNAARMLPQYLVAIYFCISLNAKFIKPSFKTQFQRRQMAIRISRM